MKRTHALAGSLLLLAGCPSDEDWTDEYTFMWEGKHVSVFGHDRAQDEACAGSFEAPCSTEPYVFLANSLTDKLIFRQGMHELIIYAKPEEAQTLTIRLLPV